MDSWFSGIKQGWECPKCGRVYAPFITECRHCGNDKGDKQESKREVKGDEWVRNL